MYVVTTYTCECFEWVGQGSRAPYTGLYALVRIFQEGHRVEASSRNNKVAPLGLLGRLPNLNGPSVDSLLKSVSYSIAELIERKSIVTNYTLLTPLSICIVRSSGTTPFRSFRPSFSMV